jgi:MFS family permease
MAPGAGFRQTPRVTGGERVTYSAVLRNREFAALLVSQGLSVAGDQLARIAVAVLVFDRTGSAFDASATYAVSYLTYLLGGPWLSALSDRYPRLRVMVLTDLLRAPLVLVLCLSGLPLWALFGTLGLVGALAPPFDSARGAVQPDVLDGEEYVLGNGVMQLVTQSAQVVGFGVGGALVAATSPSTTLAIDAATFLLSAGVLLANLSNRPGAPATPERHSLVQDTVAGARIVGGDPRLRMLLSYALLGSAAVIAPEGLAVPVARSFGEGAFAAGVLTACVPLGYLLASVALLRLPAPRRLELLPGLTLLGCLPLLLTPLTPSVVATAALWLLAGAGGSVNLIASAAYMQTCPREYRARAYGLAGTSLCAVQGLALVGAGLLAEPVGPRASVALLALATLVGLALVSRTPTIGAQGFFEGSR